MQVNVSALVWEELAEAALYYERQSEGLGTKLMQEVDSCLKEIANAPERAMLRKRGYRRVNLRQFPFFIAYLFDGDEVVVLAIGHGARRPEYWIDRAG